MPVKKLLILAVILSLAPAVAQAETSTTSVAGVIIKAGDSSNTEVNNFTITSPPTAAVGATFISGTFKPIQSSIAVPSSASVEAAASGGSSVSTISAPIGAATAGSSGAGSNVIAINPAPAQAEMATAPDPQPALVALPASARQEIQGMVTKSQILVSAPAIAVEPSAAEQAEIAHWFEDKKPVNEQPVIKKSVITKKVVKKKTVTVKKKLIVKVKKNSVPAR